MVKENVRSVESQVAVDEQPQSTFTYEPPAVTDVFELEALATTCTGTNAKSDTALGCNAGALFS